MDEIDRAIVEVEARKAEAGTRVSMLVVTVGLLLKVVCANSDPFYPLKKLRKTRKRELA